MTEHNEQDNRRVRRMAVLLYYCDDEDTPTAKELDEIADRYDKCALKWWKKCLVRAEHYLREIERE